MAALLLVLVPGCTVQVAGAPAPQSQADQEQAFRTTIRSIDPALDDERAIERGRATCDDLRNDLTRGLVIAGVIFRHLEAYPLSVQEAQQLIVITHRMLC